MQSLQLPPFLSNLILFSPLLLLAGAILYLLDKGDSLRRGAGLKPEVPPPPEETLPPETTLADEDSPSEEDEEDSREAEDEDLESLLQPPPPDTEAADDSFNTTEPLPPQPPRHQNQHPHPHPHQNPPVQPRTRTVGTKKARSLARRDQRRAYHEFLHSQRAQRESAEASLREAEAEAAFENARRRALLDEEIAARQKAERMARAESERLAKEKEVKDVESLKALVKKKPAWEVQALVEKVGRGRGWVESVLRREGLVGVREDGSVGMITGAGWWVLVGPEELKSLWGRLEEKGGMEWREMAMALEEVLGIA